MPTRRRAACAVAAVALAMGLRRSVQLFCGELCLFVMCYFHNSLPWATWQKDAYYMLQQPKQGHWEVPLKFNASDDQTTRVCKLSMYVKWAEELHSGIVLSSLTSRDVTLPPEERAEAYVKVCREVLSGLPKDSLQRKILEALHPVPSPWQFHLNVTHAWMNGRFTKAMWHGMDQLMQRPPGRESPPHAEWQWGAERDAQADALPGFEDRLKSREELRRTLPPRILRGLEELGIRPVRDDSVAVEEIPEALLTGRTAVFDATKLCGKDVFNLTIPDIARLHGEMAHKIPAFKLFSGGIGDGSYDTLAELGHRFQTWNDMGWQHYPDFGPFPDKVEIAARDRATKPSSLLIRTLEGLQGLMSWETLAAVRGQLAGRMNQYRQMNTQTTINVRRLPHFPLQDMHKAMGSPSWVERLWNLLWIGPVGDFWHFDEEDNLLICISGNIYVAVMEQNVTDIVSGTRNVGLGFNNLIAFFYNSSGGPHWVDYNKWIRKIPIHFLKLEPGMGITVPSRTYHNVMALDGNRILMNCFFMPRFGALADAPASKYSWYRPGTQSDVFRALWHLKMAAVGRLWDTQRIGGFFAGYKLEFM